MYNTDEEYNQDEELEIAEAMYHKALILAEKEGLTPEEAEQAALKQYDKARRRYAVEFMKRLEKKLSELSNQEVASILLALIASGLPVESEEELEYWIKRLERESLHRIAVYFMTRNKGLPAPGNLKMSPNHKKKLLKNIKDFTSEDIDAFTSMMSSINKAMERRIPKNKTGEEYKKFLEKEKFFKKVEKLLKKDAQEKKKEERRLQQEKVRDSANNNKQSDHLQALKSKMLGQGVPEGGNYWNNVLGDYTLASNKGQFVQKWQKNDIMQKAMDEPGKLSKAQLQELRGVDNRAFRKVAKEKLNQKSDSENAPSKISPQNMGSGMSR